MEDPPGRGRPAGEGVLVREKLNKERRAKAARRSSRFLSPRPPLRDFTKEIGLERADGHRRWMLPAQRPPCRKRMAAAGSKVWGLWHQSPWGLRPCNPAPCVRAGGSSGKAMGGTKSKPSGSAWFTTRGLSADFFGASPVASASGFRLGRDPAADNCNCTTEVLSVLRKPELSTLPGIGTFYFALTCTVCLAHLTGRGGAGRLEFA